MKKPKYVVPLKKCARCARFNGVTCPLQDLEPCNFKPKENGDRENNERAA